MRKVLVALGFSLSAFASAHADLQFDPAEDFFLVRRSYWVDLYCSSRTEPGSRWMGTEFCELDRISPQEYVRVLGTVNEKAERVLLLRGKSKIELKYNGSKGRGEWRPVLDVLEEGDNSFTYQLLSTKEKGQRSILEEGKLEGGLTVRNEMMDKRTYYYFEHLSDRCTFRPSPSEICNSFPGQPLFVGNESK